ncbi:hypothetical protein V3C99_010016, partial [Haemonchus contortus]
MVAFACIRTATLLVLAFGVANGIAKGWVKFGWAYKVFDSNLSFDQAEAKCVAEGGHLASIHSHEENEFISAITKTDKVSKNQNYTDFVWIGLQQKNWPKDKKWTWTDGTPVDYLNWAPAEPDNKWNSEHCAEIFNTPKLILPNSQWKKWNDYGCHIKMKYFVCKKKFVE